MIELMLGYYSCSSSEMVLINGESRLTCSKSHQSFLAIIHQQPPLLTPPTDRVAGGGVGESDSSPGPHLLSLRVQQDLLGCIIKVSFLQPEWRELRNGLTPS
ncbi:hypothetical protein J6590_038142 [Homalodisca vitripennis]|nr:hypothetical protein J6590_038142 [Homalodisca vitripennis]